MLIVDTNRKNYRNASGIFVRAKCGDEFGSYDIAELTKDSLLEWLRSRDDNPDTGASWREQVILAVLRHPHA